MLTSLVSHICKIISEILRMSKFRANRLIESLVLHLWWLKPYSHLTSAFAFFFDLYHQMQMLSMNTVTCCHRTHSWRLTQTQTQTLSVNKALENRVRELQNIDCWYLIFPCLLLINTIYLCRYSALIMGFSNFIVNIPGVFTPSVITPLTPNVRYFTSFVSHINPNGLLTWIVCCFQD